METVGSPSSLRTALKLALSLPRHAICLANVPQLVLSLIAHKEVTLAQTILQVVDMKADTTRQSASVKEGMKGVNVIGMNPRRPCLHLRCTIHSRKPNLRRRTWFWFD